MANKRNFKKYIDTVCKNIIADMTFAACTVEGADVQAIDNASIELLKAGAEAVIKSSVKFDRTMSSFDNAHEYYKARRKFFNEVYKKVHEEFAQNVSQVLKSFNAAFPSKATK